MIIMYSDGAARGNPGPASIGVSICENGKEIATIKETIGERSNNWAEYEAVKRGLEKIAELFGGKTKDMEIECRMDSLLVKEQLSGKWKIKNADMKEKHTAIRSIVDEHFPNISFVHIPREKNTRSDELANEALDNI